MGLSKRLKLIADLVTPSYRVSDIGTDHGYVPIYLLKNNICPSAIAVDISKGSLAKAIENVRRVNLEAVIECRLSDGLTKLDPYESDSIIIAGMGGILIDKILRAKPEVVKTSKELIISPHRNPELIRQYAEENGYEIISENTIVDKKKTYTVFKIKISH